MKNLIPTKSIPLLVLGCGGLGLALRRLLYAVGVDDRGLLADGHFLHIACWVLTLAVAVCLALAIFRLDGSNHYEDNFPASLPGAVGAFLAAGGILVTVLTGRGPYPDTLTQVWMILGVLSALSLAATGLCRLQGRKPFFALHAMVCVFFAVHLANQYRVWSGNPQTQDYSFPLLACIGLMLAAYYHTAFDVGLGQRRVQLFSSLMSTFLCCLSLAQADTPLLYLGCGAWTFLNLCPLSPSKRRRRPSRDDPEASEPEVE